MWASQPHTLYQLSSSTPAPKGHKSTEEEVAFERSRFPLKTHHSHDLRSISSEHSSQTHYVSWQQVNLMSGYKWSTSEGQSLSEIKMGRGISTRKLFENNVFCDVKSDLRALRAALSTSDIFSTFSCEQNISL